MTWNDLYAPEPICCLPWSEYRVKPEPRVMYLVFGEGQITRAFYSLEAANAYAKTGDGFTVAKFVEVDD